MSSIPVVTKVFSRMALAAAALGMLGACAIVAPGVRTMSKSEKTRIHAGTDTIYVLSSHVYFRKLGLLLSRREIEREGRTARLADSILVLELTRWFPGLPVVRPDSNFVLAADSRSLVVNCDVRAYRRTLPREILSAVTDVVFMVPTFAFNLGYPIHPTSRVRIYLTGRDGGTLILKHADEVEADRASDLGFQIRNLLDPDWRG